MGFRASNFQKAKFKKMSDYKQIRLKKKFFKVLESAKIFQTFKNATSAFRREIYFLEVLWKLENFWKSEKMFGKHGKFW